MMLVFWNDSYFITNYKKQVSTAIYKGDMNILTLLV